MPIETIDSTMSPTLRGGFHRCEGKKPKKKEEEKKRKIRNHHYDEFECGYSMTLC